jgi:hypothetical protein
MKYLYTGTGQSFLQYPQRGAFAIPDLNSV